MITSIIRANPLIFMDDILDFPIVDDGLRTLTDSLLSNKYSQQVILKQFLPRPKLERCAKQHSGIIPPQLLTHVLDVAVEAWSPDDDLNYQS